MQKIKTFLKALWDKLSGKKRNIALIYWSVLVPALTILWPDGAPAEINKTSSIIGLFLTYLGLGHAAIKKMGSSSTTEEVTEEEVVPEEPSK